MEEFNENKEHSNYLEKLKALIKASKERHVEKTESIVVTNIINPSKIFLRFQKFEKDFLVLNQLLDNCSAVANDVTDYKKGKCYLIKHVENETTEWRRGILVKIYEGTVKPLEMFLMDFGIKNTYGFDSVKTINEDFTKISPFVYKCSLYGLLPTKEIWYNDATDYVQYFTSCKNNLSAIIHDRKKKVYEIDIYSKNECLSEGMLFTGLANETEFRALNVRTVKKYFYNLYWNTSEYAVGKVLLGKIVSVEHPGWIYARHIRSQNYIKDLQSNMACFYSENDAIVPIFCPKIGNIYAAYIGKNDWCRVLVLNLLECGNVKVLDMDSAIEYVLCWSKLYKLEDAFFEQKFSTIIMGLAGIAPLKGNNKIWSDEIIDYVRSYSLNKDCYLTIIDIKKTHLNVLLKLKETQHICFNQLLLNNRLVKATLNGYKEIETYVNNQYNPDQPKKNGSQIKLICNTNNVSSYRMYAQIDIMKIISPSQFYISSPTWISQKNLLKNNMFQFYKDKVPANKKWKIGDRCVVLHNKMYSRGIVIKNLENDVFEVDLRDDLLVEVVSSSDMYKFDSKFTSHDFVYECKLEGVKPNEENVWSTEAVEYFNKFVNEYRGHLYISHVQFNDDEEIPTNVVVVAMWEEEGGALEKNDIKLINLNQELIENGLVFPVMINKIHYAEIDELSKTPNILDLVSENELIISKKKLTSWIPSNGFPDNDFIGIPFSLNQDGSVNIVSLEQNDTLSVIHSMLQSIYMNSLPDPLNNWLPNDICVVQHEPYTCFYRAQIIHFTDSGQVVLKLIDLGLKGKFDVKNLRVVISCIQQYPIQLVQCTFANVKPPLLGYLWPKAVITTLNTKILKQNCRVLVHPSENLSPKVSLFFQGECINQTLKSWNWKSNTPDEHLENTIKYIHISVPDDPFNANVINLIDYETVVLEYHQFKEHDLIQEYIKKLEKTINSCISNQNVIENQAPGMLCVVKYEKDDMWHRAEIVSVDLLSHTCDVFFVDYGNIETVSSSEIRSIEKSWTTIPTALIKCKLWNIKKTILCNDEQALQFMDDCILEKQVLCVVEVKTENIVHYVRLLDPLTKNLSYQSLFDNDVIVNIFANDSYF